MPCFRPLYGYLAKDATEAGKYPIVFSPRKALGVDVIRQIPCGRCYGCLLERSRQWAMRCVHEASLYEKNCFITLTFNDWSVPGDGSLDLSIFQKFMKRLRKKFGSGVRYFHCGEYGELLQRPHYHACLFNFDFSDRVLWSVRNGVKLYRSADLESLWVNPLNGVSLGFSTVGDVTFDSAAYVARYCVKKVFGHDAPDHYGDLKPEYVSMSRRPGLSSGFFDKWKDDIYPHDYVVINGFKCKPARFYDNKYDLTNHNEMVNIKTNRKKAALVSPDNTHARLKDREVVAKARASQKERCYETDRL